MMGARELELRRLASALRRRLLHLSPITVRCSRIVADQPTKGGRVYPRAVVERMAADANERAADGTFFGQIGNRPDGRTRLSEVSHVWRPKFRVENGMLVGEAEILDTPAGRDLQTILGLKADVEIAPRGIGSVERRDDVDVVQADYRPASFDLVLSELRARSGFGISSKGAKPS